MLAFASAGSAHDAMTRSPRAATNQGKTPFEATFVPEGGKLLSIEVNVGEKYRGKVVEGLRFVGEEADGKRVETVVGPAVGAYERPIEIKPGVEVVGISGEHGLVIDSPVSISAT
jgi:hypothetical protein